MWSDQRRQREGLDRLDALVADALAKLGLKSGDAIAEFPFEQSKGYGRCRRAAINRIIKASKLRRADFPTNRQGDWIVRVGASLARVSGCKGPELVGDAYRWSYYSRDDDRHYAHPCYRPLVLAKCAKIIGNPIGEKIAIRAGIKQPHRPRPRNVERMKRVNAERAMSDFQREAFAAIEQDREGFDAALTVAEQVKVMPKAPTKRELRAMAKAERERLKAEKEAREEAERQRKEQERFREHAEANGRRVLAAERKRVVRQRPGNADDTAFSRDF